MPKQRKIILTEPVLEDVPIFHQTVQKFHSLEHVQAGGKKKFQNTPSQFDPEKQHYLHVELVYSGRSLTKNEKEWIEDQITTLVNNVLSTSPITSEVRYIMVFDHLVFVIFMSSILLYTVYVSESE